LERLGSGTFGEVYRVRRVADGIEYALKKVNYSGFYLG
jgi:serine/threonine protein kinase